MSVDFFKKKKKKTRRIFTATHVNVLVQCRLINERASVRVGLIGNQTTPVDS